MSSITKFYILTGAGLGIGAVFLGLTYLEPTSFKPNALVSQSKETTALTADTASSWTTIPGPDQIEITWQHTLYSLVNWNSVSAICC
jgi:hypothetical protein